MAGLPGGPLYWTLVTVILLFAPSLVSLMFSVGRAWASPQKGEVQEAFVGFGQNLTITLINLAFLPHQMLMALDAITRSLVRRFITGERLLEWETAAQAESTGGKTTPVDRYLQSHPIFTIALALVIAIVHKQSLVVAAPLLVLWLFESAITAWLNAPPQEDRQSLTGKQQEFLREMALRTWRFFYEYGGAGHNYLVPDNVEEDELFEAARVSPTNFGLLLNARQAAHTFGYLTAPELVDLSHRSLDTFDRMEKRNGHIYNWYDTRTLEPILPRVVSSVDSGNLAASFYTLRWARKRCCCSRCWTRDCGAASAISLHCWLRWRRCLQSWRQPRRMTSYGRGSTGAMRRSYRRPSTGCGNRMGRLFR